MESQRKEGLILFMELGRLFKRDAVKLNLEGYASDREKKGTPGTENSVRGSGPDKVRSPRRLHKGHMAKSWGDKPRNSGTTLR